MALRPALLVLALAPAALAPWMDGADRPPSAAAIPDFETRVLPMLTKIGCNAGRCHGAAGGQAGFALSLRGYDADADFDAIVRERSGRRVDLGDAERSLLLRKPSVTLAHKGGRKLPAGSPEYATVRAWIDAGAPRRSGPERRVASLELEPASTRADAGEAFPLRAFARFTDGAREDVTALALFSSSSEGVAAVDGRGRVTAAGPGDAAVVGRFGNALGRALVSVPFGPARPFAPDPAASAIDRLVDAKLASMGVPASPAAGAAELLRRASLDLAGRLPSPEEAAACASEPGGALARRLLRSPEAVAHWTRWLADLLRVRPETMTAAGASAVHEFLRASVARREPLDATARSLITAAGPIAGPGPAAFALATPGPREQMEFVVRSFSGLRLHCAQCHQHPYDRWSRDDYYGAASFFARVRADRGSVRVAREGEIDDPRTGGDARLRLPGGEPVSAAGADDRRALFADWVLDRSSLRFDRVVANRVWKHLFGRGLVEPADDLREGNPAANEELLDHLARSFRDGGRDLLGLVERIASTAAYARSSATVAGNERDERYASHALARPLPASVLFDAMARAAGATPSFPREPGAKSAAELVDRDGGSATLAVLGRCPRDGSSDPLEIPAPGVAMALHLLHGPVASGWVAAPEGRVAGLVKRRAPAAEAVAELFLATLGRPPSAAERSRALAEVGEPPRAEALEDLLWALLASTEFAFNH